MATILEFKFAPRPAAASVLAACDASASAEIVLFPGVRYERQGDEVEDQRKANRHRDDHDLQS
jgi:hypothetical protein